MDDLLIDFILTVIGGGIGGLLVHLSAWRLFKKQSKFEVRLQDTIKKRNLVRHILATSEDAIAFKIAVTLLIRPDPTNRRKDLRDYLKSAKPLFQGNDQVTGALNGLEDLLQRDELGILYFREEGKNGFSEEFLKFGRMRKVLWGTLEALEKDLS